MSRLMSVSLTEQAVLDRTKTVTRRLGWLFLKPGDRLTLCRKVMGRRPGEPLVRLAEVRVVSVRRESLAYISDAEVIKEGFAHLVDPVHPQRGAIAFAVWFADTFHCDSDERVTRIEWEYLDEGNR